jgi:nucleoid-associated protein YgaU
MIESIEIEGVGKATVVYITSDFKPTTKEKADLIKVIPDEGLPFFLNAKNKEEDEE